MLPLGEKSQCPKPFENLKASTLKLAEEFSTAVPGCPSIRVNGAGRVFYSGTLGSNSRYSGGTKVTCGSNPANTATCSTNGNFWTPSSIDCAASACGKNDPHFELTGLATNETFTFDFHGQSQRATALSRIRAWR
ncbi:hypothetical protein KFL_000040080 [Klebsormidium nitens]|uniref:Uncharacterized protein n=1 Tax=Klebsormidium nitens TaxID=105231 RepID=A0A1Y1HMN5_KLENI|nr:hypothetical protein KFL_000040080 [Klebsormidium nitens]|eukprot:GAQ77807.1 hypothetical protein KFL_000040080 [Klebsormidium nitens]